MARQIYDPNTGEWFDWEDPYLDDGSDNPDQPLPGGGDLFYGSPAAPPDPPADTPAPTGGPLDPGSGGTPVDDGGGDDGGGGGGGFDLGPLLQGYSGTFTPPPFGEAFTKLSSLLGPAPTFKARPLPTLETFTPTTEADLYADPSFGFRKGIGEKALLNSRAAQGLVRTGGTLKDLLDYNQNFASQEFGNVDARRVRDYGLNKQNALDLYDRGFDADRAEYEPKLFEWSTKGTLGSRAEENAYNNAFKAFTTDFDMWRSTQDDIFNRLKWASEFGLDAAGS